MSIAELSDNTPHFVRMLLALMVVAVVWWFAFCDPYDGDDDHLALP